MNWTCRCGQVNTELGPCAACLNPPPADTMFPEEEARGRRRWVPVVAALLAVLLVLTGAGATLLLLAGDRDRGDDRVAAPSSPAMGDVVPELSAFVESARGLEFKEPVEVVLLDGEAFRARLVDTAELDPEELEETATVLRALGLLERGADIHASLEDLLGAAVVGFYDPETGELVVRGAEASPGVRITLVHELTHALQDQHFELHRPKLHDADDERSLGFDGLVEGDAERIADAYRRSLSAEERKAAEREQVDQSAALAMAAGDIPRVLIDILTFPYAVGPSFVEAVHAVGPDRLDAAFADPPATSEHLLHPDRYLAGDARVDVEPPAADGEVLDQGVLGELGLLLVLQDAVAASDLFPAVEGWGGDWYVAWTEGDAACIRAQIVMDTADDGRELRSALEAWVEEQPDATVAGDGGGPIDLTACA